MTQVEVHRPDGVRLQKVLAAAGLGSRRKCEVLIERGFVKVNGQVVDSVGVRVNPDEVVIEVKGKRISVDESKVVAVLNKPRGVVSTMSDPQGRRSLGEFVTEFDQRLFHVGRLDADTTGLLLLTNDGELANRLAHPSYGVPKTYVAKVDGAVPRSLVTRLREGVELEDGPVRASDCAIVDVGRHESLVRVELLEGRNRIVRRMFDKVGHPVIDLVRTDFGPISLGNLKPGEVRLLDSQEVGSLMAVVDL